MTRTEAPRTHIAPRFAGERRLAMVERRVPEPGEGELLLEVLANAICGSDRGLWERGCDVTPGHEAAGVVVAAGLGTTVPPGTLGVVYLMGFCGSCRSCRLGLTNQCLAKRSDMGFTHDGGYGPYELVAESSFFPVDADMDPAEATLLLDVMGTSGHAIGRARLVRSDIESVAVAGAGPTGLGAVAMARLLLGPDVTVVIADPDRGRLALAERLGASVVDPAQRSIADGLAAAGLQGGADIAIDTSGSEQARRALLKALGRRGVLVCVGHGGGLLLDVSQDVIAPERAILGSEYFRFDELPGNLELLRRHHDDLAPMVTHRFPRARLAEALETFFGGGTGKVVVVP